MISEEVLRDLLARRAESKNLDYKRAMNWASATNEDKCELVKDILAMMNVQDGGQIIFGVEDTTCEPVGLNTDDLTSFDPTKLNDFVHKYSDPPSSCDLQKLSLDSRTFVVIDVREFSDTPVICKADAASTANRSILKRGGIYMRTDRPSSELASTSEQMRDLIGRAMMKRGDQLLRTIQGLFVGDKGTTSADDLSKYAEELREAISFIDSSLPPEVIQQGYFEVIARPTIYSSDRIPNLSLLTQALQDAEVSTRLEFSSYRSSECLEFCCRASVLQRLELS